MWENSFALSFEKLPLAHRVCLLRPPLVDLRMSVTLKGLATLSPLAFPHSYTNYLSQSDGKEKLVLEHRKSDRTSSEESKVVVGEHSEMLSLELLYVFRQTLRFRV